MKAVCKIIREASAEDLLVAAGLCQEGTVKKMSGDKANVRPCGACTGKHLRYGQQTEKQNTGNYRSKMF